MRLIGGDAVSASSGLATDEALMAAYARDREPVEPTLRLYTYAGAALVGRYQHLDAEVDTEASARVGIDVNRRPTGGGAIVMGPGQLGIACVDRAPPGERPRETLERVSGHIVAGLRGLGIDARFRGKNDLESGGRKICGLGIYLDDRGAMLFHASLLADLDVPAMLRVLRVPAAKLGDKGVEAVEQRVTTVSRETGDRFDGASLRDAVAAGFGVTWTASEPRPDEIAAAEALEAARYRTDAWLRLNEPDGGCRGSALAKTQAGLVRVYVGLQDGAIAHVLFTGDFSAPPPELAELESALRWTRLDRVPQTVERVYASVDEPSVPAVVATTALLEAGERAAARSPVAEPDRQGSCYFPEA